MGKRKVVSLATEEYLFDLLTKNQFDGNSKQDLKLETYDKTILGSINELYDTLKRMTPELTTKARMYYGLLDISKYEGINSFRDITREMLENDPNMIITMPMEKVGQKINDCVPGLCLVVAVPTMYHLDVKKDDGFGNKVKFDESVLGANGEEVLMDNVPYQLYGEFLLTSGPRKIHVTATEGFDYGNCLCEDISIEDINTIMQDVFENNEE